MAHRGDGTSEMKASSAIGTAVLWGLVVLAACGPGDTGRDREVVGGGERDSAGVRIVETPSGVLETALPWVVDTVPSLELGGVEVARPSQFHEISGIVGLPDGGLVVVDGSSGELRWFGPSGDYVRSVGGHGRGVGEFGHPLLVPQFRTDSLLIFDRVRRAFTFVAVDGSGARAVRVPLGGVGLFAGTPRAAAGSKALFVSASETGSCPVNEHCEVPLISQWVDVSGAHADTLVVGVRRLLNLAEPSGARLLLDGPLDQEGLAAAAAPGPVVEGYPQFELRQFDMEGELIAIFRIDAAARSSVEDALGRVVEDSSDPEALMRIFHLMELPEALPAYQALLVDHLGWYWAELFRVGQGPSEWVVFDPQGWARGVIELPSDIEVHDIGEDYVSGVWTAGLGVDYVRRYGLTRHGG